MRRLVVGVIVLGLSGCGNADRVSSGLFGPLVDDFALRVAIVAETPLSIIIRYNTVSSSLADATAIAQTRCQVKGHDAMLQVIRKTGDFLSDAQFACL